MSKPTELRYSWDNVSSKKSTSEHLSRGETKKVGKNETFFSRNHRGIGPSELLLLWQQFEPRDLFKSFGDWPIKHNHAGVAMLSTGRWHSMGVFVIASIEGKPGAEVHVILYEIPDVAFVGDIGAIRVWNRRL